MYFLCIFVYFLFLHCVFICVPSCTNFIINKNRRNRKYFISTKHEYAQILSLTRTRSGLENYVIQLYFISVLFLAPTGESVDENV